MSQVVWGCRSRHAWYSSAQTTFDSWRNRSAAAGAGGAWRSAASHAGASHSATGATQSSRERRLTARATAQSSENGKIGQST